MIVAENAVVSSLARKSCLRTTPSWQLPDVFFQLEQWEIETREGERERERERGEDVDDGKKRDFFLFNKKNSLWNKVKNIYIILMI
jgi:hypothetical protein